MSIAAREELVRAVAIEPQSAVAYHQLGRSYDASGEYHSALQARGCSRGELKKEAYLGRLQRNVEKCVLVIAQNLYMRGPRQHRAPLLRLALPPRSCHQAPRPSRQQVHLDSTV